MFEGERLVWVWLLRDRAERWAVVGAGVVAGCLGVAAVWFVFWLPWSGLVLALAGGAWAGVAWVAAGCLGGVEKPESD
ncbi:MAG: hypothetical protein OHK005_14800 [Candidatus Methylacidiphilales bacterium]